MINVDSIAFGDYPNIYGGVSSLGKREVANTQVYELAVKKAKELGITVQSTEELDGFYKRNGQAPEIESNTFYTNPWTYDNPAPNREVGDQPQTGMQQEMVQMMDMLIRDFMIRAM